MIFHLRRILIVTICISSLIFVHYIHTSYFVQVNPRKEDTGLRKFTLESASENFNTTKTKPENESRYIFHKANPIAGLGNNLFIYAAAFGIARSTGRSAFFDGASNLKQYFNISMPTADKAHYKNTLMVGLISCGYDPNVETIPNDRDVKINGFVQSYKYFENHEDELHQELEFTPDIEQECTMKLESYLRKIKYPNKNCVVIGAHMRRGDFVSAQPGGYRPANKNFLIKAIEYYRSKFENQCIRFIIIGNDYGWNIEAAPKSSDVFVVPLGNSPPVDLCIMSKCNHSIMSSGSFSWWGSWLANGHVVYDQLQFWDNSYKSRSCSTGFTTYIPRHWIPLKAMNRTIFDPKLDM